MWEEDQNISLSKNSRVDTLAQLLFDICDTVAETGQSRRLSFPRPAADGARHWRRTLCRIRRVQGQFVRDGQSEYIKEIIELGYTCILNPHHQVIYILIRVNCLLIV
jgi:hypothetical protein